MRRTAEDLAAYLNNLGIRPGEEQSCPGYFERNGMACIGYGNEGEAICHSRDGWICHSRDHIQFMYINWDGAKWIVQSLAEKQRKVLQ